MNSLRLLLLLAAAVPVAVPALRAAADGCCCAESTAAAPAAALSARSIYQLDATWTDDRGQAVKLAELRGRPVVLALFFTSCGYACPRIVDDMTRIQATLPAAVRNRARFVLVSFDDERDTVAVLHTYREQHELNAANWVLLRGAPGDIRELAAVLGVKYKKDARGMFRRAKSSTNAPAWRAGWPRRPKPWSPPAEPSATTEQEEEPMKKSFRIITLTAALTLLAASQTLRAHCDTLNGPVVQAAREALAKGDVTPVLKWVKSDQEAEIRAAFDQTLAVRKLSKEAAELADRYFFETLVRIHRAGEGEPYTGLKPAEAVDPGIEAADRALETGAIDGPMAELAEHLVHAVRAKFEEVRAKQRHMNDSVEAGREYVEAYVGFIHYYEQLHAMAEGAPAAVAEHHQH
jgi:cytochrome oxidase Cu insertion factor (SCO1/SenC/PrrC family)